MTTKASFTARIAEETGFSKAASSQLLDLVSDIITNDLKTGGVALIPGVGKIKTVDLPARTGRNPRTGDAMDIPARKAARLRASSTLLQQIQ